MKLIKQPNGWTCAASCVCMITGTTLDDFYAFCGHDGSEPVEVTTARWMGPLRDCEYAQNWAHSMDVDGSYRGLVKFRADLNADIDGFLASEG